MTFSKLKNYTDDILKAEIGALLFNLGKTHIGFWREKNYFNVDDNKFKSEFGYKPFSGYKSYYKNHSDINKTPFEFELEKTSNKLKDFIFNEKVKFSFEIEPQNKSKKECLWSSLFKGNTLTESEDCYNFIQKIFFRGCENINSGIDKGSPQDSNQLKQLWISNAFGSITKKVTDEKDFDAYRMCFLRDLHRFLEDNYYYNSPEWKEIRGFVLDRIKPWYSRLLSDSRYPVNDVTLWDQAYMTASMFKATLASLYLDNSKDNNNKTRLERFLNDPQEIKWSILGIQYDKLGLAEKGLKAASIKWYRETSEKVDNEVKKIIEINYALGNEIYRDETGIYFIVGENIIGEKEGDFYRLNEDLSELKDKIIGIFSTNFGGEVYPAILLTEPSRGLMNLGHLIEKSKENFLKAEIPPNFKDLLKNDDRPDGICQVCGVRLASKKDKEGNDKDNLICNVCLDERQQGRIDEWIQNIDKETIWTCELQDKNGRIALVTLKFELDRWINGDLVNSLLNQNISFPIKHNCADINALINDITDALKNNKKINDTCLENYHKNVSNKLRLKEIAKKWFLERSIGSKWEEFIKDSLSDKTAIDFKNRKIIWNKLTDSDIKFLSQLLLQFLLRKNPSPARLKRIWDTTKEFFRELKSNITDLAGIPKERQQRFVWNNIKVNGSPIPDGEYWDGDIEFWARKGTVYLITSIEKVNGKDKFNLRKRNGSSNIITLKKTQNPEDYQSYDPYFTILSRTPVSWQFIIPAEYVPTLIKNVQKEYYKNFKWVYGKLPLHIGVVVQNYKKPLYVGIKALRKIRRDGMDWKSLRQKVSAKDFKSKQKIAFYYQQIPEQNADCENFYSLYERADGTQEQYEFYLYPEGEKVWIDTIQNSNDTDKFWFYPNTFDFEFLDTNARRNDIYYGDNAKRVIEYKTRRPYYTEDWQYFEKFIEYFNSDKKLSSKKLPSRMQKLASLIYSKLEDWGDNNLGSLKQFMTSAFINVLDLKDDESKDKFANILGYENYKQLESSNADEFKNKLLMLIDMFEFWHTMLKKI